MASLSARLTAIEQQLARIDAATATAGQTATPAPASAVDLAPVLTAIADLKATVENVQGYLAGTVESSILNLGASDAT